MKAKWQDAEKIYQYYFSPYTEFSSSDEQVSLRNHQTYSFSFIPKKNRVYMFSLIDKDNVY